MPSSNSRGPPWVVLRTACIVEPWEITISIMPRPSVQDAPLAARVDADCERERSCSVFVASLAGNQRSPPACREASMGADTYEMTE